MKRIFLLIILFLGIITASFANLPPNIPTNGLVGYWPFNGNANDESGNGFHGTVNGAILATDRFGIANKAYSFNGVNCCGTPDAVQDIVVNENLLNLNENFTVSCWMNSKDVSKYQQCLFNTIEHTGFAVELNNEHVPGILSYGVGPANAFWDLLYARGTYNNYQNNTWYHVAFVKNGTKYSMYLNGILDGSSDVLASANYEQAVGIVMGSIGGGHEVFKGRLDDYAVWNRALTEQEITNLYDINQTTIPNLPPNIPTNGLLAYYPFNGNANDESGNGNHGTIVGATPTINDENTPNTAYFFNGLSSFIDLPNEFANGATLSNQTFRIKFKYTESGVYTLWNKDGFWKEVRISIDEDNSIALVWAHPNQYYHHVQTLPNTVLPNVWNDVVIVVANNNIDFYINNIRQLGYQVNNFSSSEMSYGHVGSCGTQYGYNRFGFDKVSCEIEHRFKGVLDEFGLWNRALTPLEIAGFYNQIATLPEISTIEVKDVSAETAIIRGNITSDGNTDIIERGVVYATTQNPTLSNNKVIRSGTSIGKYSTVVKGLEPLTTYYARPYVTNSVGTSYGDQITFTTRKNSQLISWGYNGGMLGNGKEESDGKAYNLNINSIKKLATSQLTSFIIKEDGTLWGTGNNYYGALGNGTTNNNLTFAQIGSENNWRDIEAGDEFTIAIKEDGSLWSWGFNGGGRLGDGTETNTLIPTRIGNDNNWKSIEVGFSHTLAIKEDGSLWAWGFNGNNQIGNGNTMTQLSPIKIGTSSWKEAKAGQFNSIGIQEDGSLWVWGNNISGQLGDESLVQEALPKRIGIDTDWNTVETNMSHILALKNDGSLWGWGSNRDGQIGLDYLSDNIWEPTRIGNSTNWVKIDNGQSDGSSFALKSDGTLWEWGSNIKKRFANIYESNLIPTQFGNDNDWVDIAFGGAHVISLKESPFVENVLSPEPTIQSKSITFHSITKNRIGLRWTKGNGSKRVVLASMGTLNNSEYLTDGTDYTAGNYGVNTLPNNTNVSVVYNGDNTTCLVEGLARNTTYYFRIMEYNGENQTANYLQTTASNNPSSKKTNKKEGEESIVGYSLNIYPNPAKDFINIEMNLPFENAEIIIADNEGREVYKSSDISKLINLDIRNFVNGTYHILISNGDEAIYNSFVIEK